VRSRRAKAEVDGMSDDAVGQLPADRQVDLLESLDGYTGPANEKRDLLKKLYRKMPIDPAFLNQDRADRIANLNAVSTDPDPLDARANWPPGGGHDPTDVDVQAKVRALNRAVEIQCRRFRIDPPVRITTRVPSASELRTAATRPSRQVTLQGQYNHTP